MLVWLMVMEIVVMLMVFVVTNEYSGIRGDIDNILHSNGRGDGDDW